MPKLGQNFAALLDQERQGMRVHKRALNYTLSQMPVDVAPNMAARFPNATSLLDGVTRYEQSLPPLDPMRLARNDIIQYIRTHPDVADFQLVLGVKDEVLDDIFRQAMAFEARG